MSNHHKQGRPPTYPEEQRSQLAEAIRQRGARGTRELIGRTISLSTLLKIAREFDVPLKRGRRRQIESTSVRRSSQHGAHSPSRDGTTPHHTGSPSGEHDG